MKQNIKEILSTQNDLIKYTVKLQNSKFRKAQKQILVDGEKTIIGLINDGFEFEYLFLKNNYDKFKDAKVKNLIYVNDEILKKISTVKTPSCAVGIIKEPEIDKNVFFDLKKIALIENIKDPGNLGTIIRSAVAFSIDGIILLGDCVDLYNAKTIRSSAQNMFKIPVLCESEHGFIKELKKNHKLIAMVVNSRDLFSKSEFEQDFILAFGSEADGLSDEIINLSDKRLTFPMDKNVESINLAICASIAFAAIKL